MLSTGRSLRDNYIMFPIFGGGAEAGAKDEAGKQQRSLWEADNKEAVESLASMVRTAVEVFSQANEDTHAGLGQEDSSQL